METSILIAKIIGFIYVSFGIGSMFNKNYYKKEIPKLLENSAFLIFGGFIAIIIGVLVIENHNFWVKDWSVVITIIGWLAFIKGILLLAFPTSFSSYKTILNSDLFYKILGPLVFIFGSIFMYLAYFN